MGCGCGGKRGNGVVGNANRSTVFQALNAQGSVVSEHSSPAEARAAATAAGGRVRVTSRSNANAVS